MNTDYDRIEVLGLSTHIQNALKRDGRFTVGDARLLIEKNPEGHHELLDLPGMGEGSLSQAKAALRAFDVDKMDQEWD